MMKLKKFFRGWGRKIPYLLGVDWQPTSLAVVELSLRSGQIRLESCHKIELDSQQPDLPTQSMHSEQAEGVWGVTQPGEPTGDTGENLEGQGGLGNSPEAQYAQMLVELARLPLHTRNAAIALPHSAIHFLELTVPPALAARQLRQLIKFRLSAVTQLPIGQLQFDYGVKNPQASSDPQVLQVVGVAKSIVQQGEDGLIKLALNPKIIDIDSHALVRAIRYQFSEWEGNIAVFHLDCQKILMVVLDPKNILWMQEQHRDHIAHEHEDGGMSWLIQQWSLLIATLQYPPRRLVISGAGWVLSSAKNLSASNPVLDLPVLKQRLQVPVDLANPFERMEIAPDLDRQRIKSLAAQMTICCGLALRVGADGAV